MPRPVTVMSLKIYFCGSIRGGRDDAELYGQIITFLQTYGTVLTEHVGGSGDMIESELKKTPKFIHDRDMAWMEESDVLVAEVTQPSLGVGYELGRAVDMKKPILCLFRPNSGKNLSCMIGGADNGDTFSVKEYSRTEYEDIIKSYFENFVKK